MRTRIYLEGGRGPGLVGAAPAEDRRERHEDDAEVTAEREVFDILALDSEHLVESELAATIDLPGAGDPRLHPQPDLVLRGVPLYEIDELGARPDDRHLAAQHIH